MQRINIAYDVVSQGSPERAGNDDSYLVAQRAAGGWEMATNVDASLDGAPAEPQLDLLMVVADGMGGMAGGDVASSLAVKAVAKSAVRTAGSKVTGLNAPRHTLESGVELAEKAIEGRGRLSPELKGMGTTLTAAALRGRRLTVAHVGDSRLYLFRDGYLHQYTRDHTFAAQLVEAGVIGMQSEASSIVRSTLSNAVLADDEHRADPEVNVVEVKKGDRVLLCTDGLTDKLSDREIAATLDSVEEPQQVTQRLVERARERGSADDLTMILADLVNLDDRVPSVAATGSAPVASLLPQGSMPDMVIV